MHVIFYIPISVSTCSDSTVYINGACTTQEINDRYIILEKQYLGYYGFLRYISMVDSKPIYLFDRNQRKVVKKGNIHVRQLTGDLVINESEDYLEIYYKGNNGSSIFFSENTPSLAEGWKIKK